MFYLLRQSSNLNIKIWKDWEKKKIFVNEAFYEIFEEKKRFLKWQRTYYPDDESCMTTNPKFILSITTFKCIFLQLLGLNLNKQQINVMVTTASTSSYYNVFCVKCTVMYSSLGCLFSTPGN